MRTPMPLRWIEEREARQMLAYARHQAQESPPAIAAKPLWSEWLRRWIPAVDEAAQPDITVEPPLR